MFRRTRIALLVCGVLALPACGQKLVESERLAAVKQLFNQAESGSQLRCEIHSVPPTLDFRFRFSAGYVVDVPLQVGGSRAGLSIYARVTPEGREPVYLMQSGMLPTASQTKDQVEIVGRFNIGEGRYNVEVVLQDDQQRFCRGTWPVVVQREVTSPTPSGTVEEISTRRFVQMSENSAPRIGRLTILLHASTLVPSHSRMQPDDIQRLVDSLLSVMRGLPAQSVRLIAFNLDQGVVIFHRDGFEAGQRRELAAALREMKLGVVDYRTLKQSQGPISLLIDLAKAELEGPKPPDALIVLGPRTANSNDVPASAVGKRPAATAVYSLQLLPPNRPIQPSTQTSRSGRERISGQIAGAESRGTYGRREDEMSTLPPDKPDFGEPLDSIQRLIGRLKGETIAVRTPHDLAEAIKRMDGRIPKSAPAA